MLCAGSVNAVAGVWHEAQDCPIGFERLSSKNNFFPNAAITAGEDADVSTFLQE